MNTVARIRNDIPPGQTTPTWWLCTSICLRFSDTLLKLIFHPGRSWLGFRVSIIWKHFLILVYFASLNLPYSYYRFYNYLSKIVPKFNVGLSYYLHLLFFSFIKYVKVVIVTEIEGYQPQIQVQYLKQIYWQKSNRIIIASSLFSFPSYFPSSSFLPFPPSFMPFPAYFLPSFLPLSSSLFIPLSVCNWFCPSSWIKKVIHHGFLKIHLAALGLSCF